MGPLHTADVDLTAVARNARQAAAGRYVAGVTGVTGLLPVAQDVAVVAAHHRAPGWQQQVVSHHQPRSVRTCPGVPALGA